MLARLFFLFTATTLVELVLLIQLGRWMGLWWTLGLVFATGFAGAYLAKAQGIKVLGRIRQDLAGSRVPTDAATDGVFILVAAALLITPGVLTDVLGFSLLVPTVRAILKRRLKKRFARWIDEGTLRVVTRSGAFGSQRMRRGEVVEVTDVTPKGDEAT